jgi:DNA-binding response OmpR family regulator
MAKILLVDDNAALLEMVALFLRGAEHVVTTAANGREAMGLVEDNTFDLVITDIVMPEEEGLGTIMKLRRKTPALKIIAISGGGSVAPEDYLSMARKFGAAQTLAKPFSGDELLAAVDRALSE